MRMFDPVCICSAEASVSCRGREADVHARGVMQLRGDRTRGIKAHVHGITGELAGDSGCRAE
eukprot:11173886-Lingulodinium_polyedra.AAC.1